MTGRLLLLLAALCTLPSFGCAGPGPWRLVERPYTAELMGENEDARVTLHDGSVVVLEHAAIVPNPWGSFVAGDGTDVRRREVDFEHIHRLEARRRAPEHFWEFDDGTQLLVVVFVLIVGAIVWNNTAVD